MDGEFGREDAIVISGLLKLPRRTAGEYAGAGRRALRIGGKAIVEESALTGDSVEARSAREAAAIRAKVLPSRIVCDCEEDIRAFARFRRDRASAHGAPTVR